MTIMSPEDFAAYARDKDPYEKAPSHWKTKPQCLYLSYITATGFTRYFHDHHEALSEDELKDVVKRMARNIDKYGVPSTIPPNAPWTRKSYIVLVAERQGLDLRRGKVLVKHKQGLQRNHTFFDGEHWTLDISSSKRNRSVFACINHMRNEGGDTLGDGESEQFRVEYPTRDERGRVHIHVLEDGNTNLGPPAPPPP